ncbi:MAG: cytochrome c [Chthoniobacteraceae bacterium]
MLRTFFALFILGVCTVLALAGFRGTKSKLPPIEIFRDMDHQPKFQPQHATTFFSDGRAARKPVEGTVPIGYNLPGRFLQVGARNATLDTSGFSNLNDYLHTGRIGEMYGDGIPVDVTPTLLDRGHERFDINCSVCHGLTGDGKGVVQQIAAWATVANLQDDRIRQQPDGQLYNTITHGKNTMGAYGPNIAVEDRWAIVAYIRALQKSQRTALADLPVDKQKELQQPAKK